MKKLIDLIQEELVKAFTLSLIHIYLDDYA